MLNFRTFYTKPIDRMFGGMLSEDWHSLGAFVLPRDINEFGYATPRKFDLTMSSEYGGGGSLTSRCDQVCAVELPGASSSAVDECVQKCEADKPMVLFPNIGYRQQLYAALYSALYAPGNTDMTLIHKMRIWVDGSEGAISDAAFPDPADQVRFYDPASGFTYIARRFGTEKIDGRDVETGIASRMLEHANDLVLQSYKLKGTGLDAEGYPDLYLNADGQPELSDEYYSKAGELVRYVGLIDAIRQIGHIFGDGPY
jgi:hypothetical protein